MLIAMIKQFLEDVAWGKLDYLIIDTPPGKEKIVIPIIHLKGTSDEHISVVELLKERKVDGAVIVTTPQAISLSDVRKEISFCQKVSLPILGIIENMSGFICPHCTECSDIFSKGGGESLAQEFKVPFLGIIGYSFQLFAYKLFLIGRIPIDPSLTSLVEQQGSCILDCFKQSQVFSIFCDMSKLLHANIDK